jgi:sulfate/thiosulfate transport system substrate-binding protein
VLVQRLPCFTLAALTVGLLLGPLQAAAQSTLLNASYDPTRRFYAAVNKAFTARWRAEHGESVRVYQSHGGSGAQARAVIYGLEADVVTLALASDIDAIANRSDLLPKDWQRRLPHNSAPYTSTIVFVVRKGNPKAIRDWPDLVKPGVEVITPNPKTSGNGKLSFLAAWGAELLRTGDEGKARGFVTEVYRRVRVLDSGARGATTTFATKGIGDVHLTWENEAYLEVEEARGALEVVYPPVSIRAEPPVAVVDANVRKKGTRPAAEAYLKFLYTDEGQNIIARHRYRPSDPAAVARHRDKFPAIELFPITKVAPGWDEANDRFFTEGAEFDRMYAREKK